MVIEWLSKLFGAGPAGGKRADWTAIGPNAGRWRVEGQSKGVATSRWQEEGRTAQATLLSRQRPC